MSPENRTPPAATPSTDPSPPLLRMEHDLYEFARKRAVQSGTTEVIEADVVPLRRHASAMARQAVAEAFEPARNPHDAIRQRDHERTVTLRDEAQRVLRFAEVAVREREAEAAGVTLRDPKPRVHPILSWGATVLIGLTVAATVRDSIFAFDDEMLSWVLSLLTGGMSGAFIVGSIIGSYDHRGSRTAARWAGVAGGGLVGLGLLLVRMAGADGMDLTIAFGLTLLELGAVWLCERAARSLEEPLSDWHRRKVLADEATARCEAALVERDRCRVRLDELDHAVGAHLRYVEARTLRHRTSEDLEECAVRAVVDGWAAGVSENRGRLLGAGR